MHSFLALKYLPDLRMIIRVVYFICSLIQLVRIDLILSLDLIHRQNIHGTLHKAGCLAGCIRDN